MPQTQGAPRGGRAGRCGRLGGGVGTSWRRCQAWDDSKLGCCGKQSNDRSGGGMGGGMSG